MTESQKTPRDLPSDAVFGHGGGHTADSKTKCIMEWAAFLAGEGPTDEPSCVSPVITIACQKFNDGIGIDAAADARRAELGFAALSQEVLGTNTTAEDEERRSYLALDWLFRAYTPAWLDLAGLKDDAAALRGASEVVDLATCAALEQIATKARANASVAVSAAWSAAWGVGSAARSAAVSAAESAAWSAARKAAWTAASTAAESAAESAARSALAPTVEALQVSFVDVIRRMCAVGREASAS